MKSLKEYHEDGQRDKANGDSCNPPFEHALDVANPFLRNDEIAERGRATRAYLKGYYGAKKAKDKD